MFENNIAMLRSQLETMLAPLSGEAVAKMLQKALRTAFGGKVVDSETIGEIVSGHRFFPSPPSKRFDVPTVGMDRLIDHVRRQLGDTPVMKRAVVTGVNGAVGTLLAELLLGLGMKVVGLDISKRSTLDLGAPAVGGDRYRFYQGDITDKKGVRELLQSDEVQHFLGGGIDALFHTAAVFKVSKNVPWELYERVNIDGARNMAELVDELDIPSAIFWSSGAIYNGHSAPCDETTPVMMEALNDYERSKYLGYVEVESYRREKDLSISYLEPTGIIGPYNNYGVGQAMKLIANGFAFANFADTIMLSVVFASDVVGAAVVLAHRLRADPDKYAGERYIIADNVPMRFPDMAALMRRIVDDRTPRPWFRIPTPIVPLAGDAIENWTNFTNELFDSDRRPVLEKGLADYVTSNRVLINRKSRQFYEYLYPNVVAGAKNLVQFYRKHDIVPTRHPLLDLLNIVSGYKPPREDFATALAPYDRSHPDSRVLESVHRTDVQELVEWARKNVKEEWYRLVDVFAELGEGEGNDEGASLSPQRLKGTIPLTPIPADYRLLAHIFGRYLGDPHRGLFGPDPNLLTVILDPTGEEIIFCCAERAEAGRYVTIEELHEETALMGELEKLIADMESGAIPATLEPFTEVLSRRLDDDMLPGVIKIANIGFFAELKRVFDQYEKDQRLTVFSVGMLHALKRIFDCDLIRFVPDVGIFRFLDRLTKCTIPRAVIDQLYQITVTASDVRVDVRALIDELPIGSLPSADLLMRALSVGMVLVLRDEGWCVGLRLGIDAEGELSIEPLPVETTDLLGDRSDHAILRTLGGQYPTRLILIAHNTAVLDMLDRLGALPTNVPDPVFFLAISRALVQWYLKHHAAINFALGKLAVGNGLASQLIEHVPTQLFAGPPGSAHAPLGQLTKLLRPLTTNPLVDRLVSLVRH